jgi:Flp pilus assembly protein TadB
MMHARNEAAHAVDGTQRRAERHERRIERREQRRERRREANEQAKAAIGVEKVPREMFKKTPLHACSLAIQRFFMRHTFLMGLVVCVGVVGGILLLAWFLLLSGFNEPVQYVYEGF